MKVSPGGLPLPHRVFRFLSRVSVRRLLGIFYILLIFVFASIYSYLHDDFYNANAYREPLVQNKLHEKEKLIAAELREEIVHTFQNRHRSGQEVVELQKRAADRNTPAMTAKWSIDANSFRVLFLKAIDKEPDVEISFKLDMKLTDSSQQHRLYIDPIVTFLAKESFGVMGGDSADESTTVRRRKLTVDVPEVPYWTKADNYNFANAFFPTERTGVGQNKKEASPLDSSPSLPEVEMAISKHLDDEILDLGRLIQGDLTSVSGHFGRWLYLSAVTITTLGYGDISPLTTRARLLISSEAVLGIIVIGFFISAAPREKLDSGPCAHIKS